MHMGPSGVAEASCCRGNGGLFPSRAKARPASIGSRAEMDFDFRWTIGTTKRPPQNEARIIRSTKKVSSLQNQITRSSRIKELNDESCPALKCGVHWFPTILLGVYVLAIIWTFSAHAAEDRITRNSIAASVALLRPTSTTGGRLGVRDYVQTAAKAAGIDSRIAEWIVSHESGLDPQATGDSGDSRGLWQINRIYHPEVSDRCAYDVKCSTGWALERIMDGNINEWSTWKYRKLRFGDTPILGASASLNANKPR
jgi:hypothetical protein